ncbi:MAG: hypothetical protein KY445_13645 [Armatimonadetes bacterium]|nr:hypothetical protein [Armatimonadota bacterium]
MKQFDVKIGAWIRTHRVGIWQIYRVINVNYLDPSSSTESNRTIVFAKRFLSDSYRRSFSEDCCHSSLIYPLSSEDHRRLDQFIQDNPQIYVQFQDYSPKPIDSIYNARINAPPGQTVKQVQKQLATDRQFSEFQIGPFLTEQGFSTDVYPQWTAQFVSPDHMCKDGTLQYKLHRVLKF